MMFHWWVLEALEHMAGFLFEAAAKVGQHSHDGACDDDFYDRLSRRYSVILLTIFTILVSTKQYVGEPIACFCPAHFTGTHVEYTNNICWISSTYFVSFDRVLPKHPDPKTERFIYFYQYVPIILIVQGIFFYLPSLIWSSLNSKSGYDLSMLVTHARLIDTYTSDLRGTSIRHLARYIDRALEYHRQKRAEYIDQLNSLKCTSFSSICSFLIANNHIKMPDHYLMWAFLFSKLLYISNAIGQLYLLNLLLGNDYHMYGFSVIRSLFTGSNENWTVNPRFPRVTWCDFTVRNLADNLHTYTVQCSLPINIFNEKIFLVVWFWLYLVTVCTVFGFFYWASSLFYPKFYKSNLVRYLSSMKRINTHHFPSNPYDESSQSRSYSRHHHSFRHYGFSHGGHHHHHHHHMLSSMNTRAMRSTIDLTRLPRLKDPLSVHHSASPREHTETYVTTTPEEPTPSRPSTPIPLTTAHSQVFSVSNEEDDRQLTRFLKNYLSRDGVLVLYLLQVNTNEVITGEIVTALYEIFRVHHCRPDSTE